MSKLDQNLLDSIIIEAAEALIEAGLKDTAAAYRAMALRALEALPHHAPPPEAREDFERFINFLKAQMDQTPDLR